MNQMQLNSRSDGHRIWAPDGMQSATYHNNGSYMSQSNHNGIRYSANNEINSYVNAHRLANQNISRSELARFPKKYQGPIFVSLSNDNKARIFIEKAQAVLRTENLRQEDVSHIQKAMSFITPEIYTESGRISISSFFENWQRYAVQNLNWSEDRGPGYFQTILMRDELSLFDGCCDEVGDEAVSGGGGTTPPADCECSFEPGQDFCKHRQNLMCQGTKACSEAYFCGWMYAFKCKGMCKEILRVANSSTSYTPTYNS